MGKPHGTDMRAASGLAGAMGVEGSPAPILQGREMGPASGHRKRGCRAGFRPTEAVQGLACIDWSHRGCLTLTQKREMDAGVGNLCWGIVIPRSLQFS